MNSKTKSLSSSKNKNYLISNLLVGILALLFLISLFKNISYPLIWNDESETVTVAQKVLEYGYPKVHDGRNIFFLPEEKTWIGYKKDGDVPIGNTWGYYYFGTIGVILSKLADDIYVKTALLRIPFALIGVFGLILFLIPFKKIINDSRYYKNFIILFIFVELFSVSLLLHMKEARYYSLVIFCCALFFNVFVNHFLLQKYSYKKYLLFMTFALFLTYHMYFIFFAILIAITGIFSAYYSGINIYNNSKKKDYLKQEFIVFIKNITPLLLACLLALPFIVFYETFETSAKASANYNFTSDMFFQHLNQLYTHFSKLEFLHTAIIIKIAYIIGWISLRRSNLLKNKVVSKEIESCLIKEKLSLFITALILIYSIVISRLPFLFVRHFITLQPLIVLMMIFDVIIIFSYINVMLKNKNSSPVIYIFSIFLIVVFVSNAQNKMPYIKSHLYEMNHQRKGPLDYIIPFIKEKYPITDSLTVATNYEELCYVYYLNCYTVLGYNYKNLEEDMKKTPDILIYRKKWGHDPSPFNQYMQKAKYERVAFPVFDSPVNNIPELDWFFTQHLFKTKFAQNENDKTEIWVRTKE